VTISSAANTTLTAPECRLASATEQVCSAMSSRAEAPLAAGERIAVEAARGRAEELLRRLLRDRDLIENRLTSVGRSDPMKTVRGTSSLECAIRTTREMIDAYDSILASA